MSFNLDVRRLFSNVRRWLCALLLIILFSAPAWAQKSLEDLPIEDVVPTPLPAATPVPTFVAPTKTADVTTETVDKEPEAATATLPGVFSLVHTFTSPHLNFMRNALWAGLLVALVCSYLGVYVVLRRIVFVGVALAELSSAGIAFGLWIGFSPIVGAMLLMLAGVVMFAVRWAPRRVPIESLIGIVYSVAGALAILCIAKSAQGEVQITKALQGDVLTVAPKETWEMLGVFAIVALIHGLFAKEFLLVSFDRDAAATLGLRTARWDFLLYLTIGIVISFSIRAAGVLVATALLIIPAVSALLVAPRMKQVWAWAMLFGVAPVVLGLHFSLVFDLPASAVIVALSFGLLLPVLAFSSRRS